MLNTVALALAETAEHSESTNAPYIVGGLALGILFLLLVLVVFAIGGGREHS